MAKKINPERMFKSPTKSMLGWDEVYRGDLTHAVKMAIKNRQTPTGCCYECDSPRPEVKAEMKRQGIEH